MTFDNICNDIKKAMLAKDNIKRDVLRALVSDIKNQTVNAGKPITDDVVLKCVQKSVKQHDDSIEQFKTANRQDLLDKEIAERKILENYLPKMHSDMTVQTIILEIINANKIPEVKKSMGQIMKLLNAREDRNLIDKKVASQYLSVILK